MAPGNRFFADMMVDLAWVSGDFDTASKVMKCTVTASRWKYDGETPIQSLGGCVTYFQQTPNKY